MQRRHTGEVHGSAAAGVPTATNQVRLSHTLQEVSGTAGGQLQVIVWVSCTSDQAQDAGAGCHACCRLARAVDWVSEASSPGGSAAGLESLQASGRTRRVRRCAPALSLPLPVGRTRPDGLQGPAGHSVSNEHGAPACTGSVQAQRVDLPYIVAHRCPASHPLLGSRCRAPTSGADDISRRALPGHLCF